MERLASVIRTAHGLRYCSPSITGRGRWKEHVEKDQFDRPGIRSALELFDPHGYTRALERLGVGWQPFVEDVDRFLDGPFRAVAAALGWGAHDLFGCDRDRPFASIDQSGLICSMSFDP